MLDEIGSPPRASPLRRGYLVHNAALNRVLRSVDTVLGWLRPRRQRSAAAAGSGVPRRILLSQPGHLGDVVNALALIAPLRDAAPGCELGFLVSSWSAMVLHDHPDVAHVHVFDNALLNRERGWRRRIALHRATRSSALSEIRRVGYDAALELSFNFPNNIALLHAAGIAKRAGWTSGGFGPLLTHPLPWPHCPGWHVTRYHQALLEHLFARPFDGAAFALERVRLPSAAAQSLAGVPEGDYTVVHLGSGGPLKAWPLHLWAALVSRLREEGRVLVFTGAGVDEEAAVRALCNGRANCVDLCGRLGWQEFVAVVGGACLVVGVDSAVGHVAATFATPSVTIYHGMTDRALYQPRSNRNRAVSREVPCAPCYRSRGCPSMDCIRTVPAEAVLEAAADAVMPAR